MSYANYPLFALQVSETGPDAVILSISDSRSWYLRRVRGGEIPGGTRARFRRCGCAAGCAGGGVNSTALRGDNDLLIAPSDGRDDEIETSDGGGDGAGAPAATGASASSFIVTGSGLFLLIIRKTS